MGATPSNPPQTCAYSVTFLKNGDVRPNIQLFDSSSLTSQNSQLCRSTAYYNQRPHFRLYDDGDTEIFYKGAPVILKNTDAAGRTQFTTIPRVLPRKIVFKFKRDSNTKEILEIDWLDTASLVSTTNVRVTGWLETKKKAGAKTTMTSGGFPPIAGGYTKIVTSGTAVNDLWKARLIRFPCGATFRFIPVITTRTQFTPEENAMFIAWKQAMKFRATTQVKNNFFNFIFHLPSGHTCVLPKNAKGFCARDKPNFLRSKCKRWSVARDSKGKLKLFHTKRHDCYESSVNKCVSLAADYVYKSTAMGS